MKHTWVIYGLDMEGTETITTEGIDLNESHDRAVKHFNNTNLEWDCCESYERYMKEAKTK